LEGFVVNNLLGIAANKTMKSPMVICGKRSSRVQALLNLFILLAFSGCHSAQTVFIPVNSNVQLEAVIYKPEGDGKFPIVIYNHGSSGGNPSQSLPASEQAKYFVNQGFVVIVPMRRGRGKSTGRSLESETKNCDIQSWKSGLDASFEDLTAVIDYAQRLPYTDSSHMLLVGASRGGFLSVAYAASGSKRSKLVGVINFVGSWVAQAQDRCPEDFNLISFKTFGRKSALPMLWLYGENDLFNASSDVKQYVDSFRTAGGNVHFELVKNVPENGHWLPDYPNLWTGIVGEYLSALGFKKP
jgi:dienelactone hydrolase